MIHVYYEKDTGRIIYTRMPLYGTVEMDEEGNVDDSVQSKIAEGTWSADTEVSDKLKASLATNNRIRIIKKVMPDDPMIGLLEVPASSQYDPRDPSRLFKVENNSLVVVEEYPEFREDYVEDQ